MKPVILLLISIFSFSITVDSGFCKVKPEDSVDSNHSNASSVKKQVDSDIPEEYRVIIDKNIFRDLTQGEVHTKKGDLDPKEVLLYGTIVAGDYSLAFFKLKGQLAQGLKDRLDKRGYLALQTGDDLEGYTVSKIDANMAVLEKDLDRIQVCLFDTENQKPEYSKRSVAKATKPVRVSPPAKRKKAPATAKQNKKKADARARAAKKADARTRAAKKDVRSRSAKTTTTQARATKQSNSKAVPNPAVSNSLIDIIKKHAQNQ